ncbi:MAG TPA: hypothetical protein VHC22_12850 [Pirellulales bacterium]|nr:hypothetical protein [Pirellulales bacterium]
MIDWQGDPARLRLSWGDAVAGWDGLLVRGPWAGWILSECTLTPVGSQADAPPTALKPPAPTDKPPSLGDIANDDGPAVKSGITATEIVTLKSHTAAVSRVAPGARMVACWRGNVPSIASPFMHPGHIVPHGL